MSSVKLTLSGDTECELTTSEDYWLWRSYATQSAEERDDLERIRTSFLTNSRPESWTTDAFVMHRLRGLLTECRDGYVLHRMDDHAVARAVVCAVEARRLIAIEYKPHYPSISSNAEKPADRTITGVSKNTPSLDTPLGVAKPFRYAPSLPSNDVLELAASTGNPRFAAKMLGYDYQTFGGILHRFKPDNGLRPNDNVIWHDNGDVYFDGKFIANFHDWAN